MWILFVILYILLAIIFTQTYKITTKTSKNDGALTILLQVMAGFSALVLCPFFKFSFTTDWKVYLFLGIACIFYAASDRLNTTIRGGLEASTFSIIKQLSTVFMIIAGLLFFKEEFVLKKIIGYKNIECIKKLIKKKRIKTGLKFGNQEEIAGLCVVYVLYLRVH